MRYYRGKPMKEYKAKVRTNSVRTFCKALQESRRPLWVRGLTAYDADGDRRIILKLKSNENN